MFVVPARAKLSPSLEFFTSHDIWHFGLDFMETNKDADKWFLQIETFDPHEPFFSHDEYRKLYPHDWDGPEFDWPSYREVREDQATVEHIRYTYAALLTFCDGKQIGAQLDRNGLRPARVLLTNDGGCDDCP